MGDDSLKVNKIFLYTMTAGLGDSLIMGDLMHKIEKIVPDSRCVMIHRSNPHINIWTEDRDRDRFYDIYKLAEVGSLIKQLRNYRKSGVVVFALQMAPGSYQGFFLHALLKRLRAVDHIVDFNLINADIVIPPEGNYILEIHVNQIKRLLKISSIPSEIFKLTLPFSTGNVEVKSDVVGIHPWSRRGGVSFTWEERKWLAIMTALLERKKKVVIFGKDDRFDIFKQWIMQELPSELASDVTFAPSQSVEHMVEQIASFNSMVSVNSATVHIGHALNKRMVILNGPSLDLWIPKGKEIVSVYDTQAKYSGNDSVSNNPDFPQVRRIKVEDVLEGMQKVID